MIACIMAKLCELIALLNEKLTQVCEVSDQQELICEKLEVLLDPDAECPDCPVTSHTFAWSGFDEDGGIFNDAGYVHTSTVNGVATTPNPLNAAWVNKSEAYANTVAAVNAIAGASMTLVSDVALLDNGKPAWTITYDVGTTLTIVNTHTNDVLTFSTAEDGVTCVGTFVDSNGDEITSYSPVEQ